MKQPGIFFGIFALLYLIGVRIYKTRAPARPLLIKCFIFISGLSIPYLLTCITLYALGVFQEFWFWTVLYAARYASIQSLPKGSLFFACRCRLLLMAFISCGSWPDGSAYLIVGEKGKGTSNMYVWIFSLFIPRGLSRALFPAALFCPAAARGCNIRRRCNHIPSYAFLSSEKFPVFSPAGVSHVFFPRRLFTEIVFLEGSPRRCAGTCISPTPFPSPLLLLIT